MKIKNLLLSIVMTVCTISAHAYDIEVDGIQYNVVSLDEMTLTVVGGNWVGDVVIPSTVTYNGRTFTVTQIAGGAMVGLYELDKITLPSSIKVIKENAIKAYKRSTYKEPLCLYIPEDNEIDSLGMQAICDYSGNAIIGDFHFPKLKHYGYNGVKCSNANASISLPKGVQFSEYTCWGIRFGDNHKIVFEDGPCEYHNHDWLGENISKVNEIYLGRAMFFQLRYVIKDFIFFEDVKKLTVAQTPDGVYNMGFINIDAIDTLICYAPTPPTSIRETTNSAYMNAKVFVPDSSIDQYKSDAVWGKFWNIYSVSQLRKRAQCERPTISYFDGKLKIESSTSGSTCLYSISDADVVSNVPVNGDINLTATYNITAYATADGYEKSETATATLCYIDGTFSTDGIETPQAAKRAVVISSNGGMITISGVEPGEEVSLYSISGSKVSSVKSMSSTATLNGQDLISTVGVLKIGNDNVKLLIK